MGNINERENEKDNEIIFSCNKNNNDKTEYKRITDEPNEFNRNEPVEKPADDYLFHSTVTLSKNNLSFKKLKHKPKMS